MVHFIFLVWIKFAEEREDERVWGRQWKLTWSCPWCCADGGQWWGPCSGKTLYGWCSGSGCLSPGRRLPWPHPGLISETSSTGHVPDTGAASVPHCKRRNLLRKSGRDGNNQLGRAQTLGSAGKNALPFWAKSSQVKSFWTWATIWVICFYGQQAGKLELSTTMAKITYTACAEGWLKVASSTLASTIDRICKVTTVQ